MGCPYPYRPGPSDAKGDETAFEFSSVHRECEPATGRTLCDRRETR